MIALGFLVSSMSTYLRRRLGFAINVWSLAEVWDICLLEMLIIRFWSLLVWLANISFSHLRGSKLRDIVLDIDELWIGLSRIRLLQKSLLQISLLLIVQLVFLVHVRNEKLWIINFKWRRMTLSNVVLQIWKEYFIFLDSVQLLIMIRLGFLVVNRLSFLFLIWEQIFMKPLIFLLRINHLLILWWIDLMFVIEIYLVSGYLCSGLVNYSVFGVSGFWKSVTYRDLVFLHELWHHIDILSILSYFKRSIMNSWFKFTFLRVTCFLLEVLVLLKSILVSGLLLLPQK